MRATDPLFDRLWPDHSTETFSVLAVSPSESALEHLRGIVRPVAGRREVVVTHVQSVGEAIAVMDADVFELSLFDLELGEAPMFRWLKAVEAHRDRLPVILLTSPHDEELTVRGLVAGATDFLFKGSLTSELLLRSMHYSLEREKSRRALAHASSTSQRFFDRCLAGAFRAMLDGRLIECNQVFAEGLGYRDKQHALTEGRLRSFTGIGGVGGDDGWLTEGTGFGDRRVCLERADGSPLWVNIQTRHLEGDPSGETIIEGTLVDLSGVEKLGSELESLENDLRSLLATMEEGVLWLDSRGRIQGCNEAVETLLGFTEKEIVGHRITDPPLVAELSYGSESLGDERLLLEALQARESTPVQATFRCKQGTRTKFSVLTRNFTAGARPGRRGAFLVFRQTERSKMGGNRSLRLETLGRMVGGLVHDFNNLLTSILGYTDLMLMDMSPEGETWENGQELRVAVLRAKSLAGQILSLGKGQERSSPILDLNRVILKSKGMLEQLAGPGIEVRCQLESQDLPLLATADVLDRILSNLVSNARGAISGRGTIELSTEEVLLRQTERHQQGELSRGRHAVLVVRDTGQGMDAATLARVYEPFFTTKTGSTGTGLGLTTVADLVRKNRGAISIDSIPGDGTTVRVILPIYEPSAGLS